MVRPVAQGAVWRLSVGVGVGSTVGWGGVLALVVGWRVEGERGSRSALEGRGGRERLLRVKMCVLAQTAPCKRLCRRPVRLCGAEMAQFT